MKLTSILLLSLGLVSGVASAGGTTEAGVGGALGGVLGAVVGQQLGGSTGSAIGAGVGGAAGSAVGADKRSRGEAAIGGALGAAGGNVLGRSVGGGTGALVGAAAGGGAGGALGNYMGNKSDADDRRYNNRDNRRYYRDDHRGRGHAYGHRKKKYIYVMHLVVLMTMKDVLLGYLRRMLAYFPSFQVIIFYLSIAPMAEKRESSHFLELMPHLWMEATVKHLLHLTMGNVLAMCFVPTENPLSAH